MDIDGALCFIFRNRTIMAISFEILRGCGMAFFSTPFTTFYFIDGVKYVRGLVIFLYSAPTSNGIELIQNGKIICLNLIDFGTIEFILLIMAAAYKIWSFVLIFR